MSGIELTPANREELFTLLKTYEKNYGDVKTALAEGKPAGEIKAAIGKIDSDIVAFQTKHA